MGGCVVVCSTEWGYVMRPYVCKTVEEGRLFAKKCNLPYCIYVNGEIFETSD